MRKMRGGASLTTLASAHRQSPLADCAGGRAGARVIHRSPARATSFRGSFYLSLLETSVDRGGRQTLFFVCLTWTWQSLIAAPRCRYSQAPSSRYTYQPRSWIGVRQKPACYWDLGPCGVKCTAAACRERRWPIESPPSWFHSTTTCSVLTYYLCTSAIHSSAGAKLEDSSMQPPDA
jgi:hypothetical protein